MLSACFRTTEKLIHWLGLWETPSFSAHKPVHRAALVLLMFGAALALVNGAAQTDSSVDAWGALQSQTLTALVFLALALLGIGLPIWRNWSQACARLGLLNLRHRDWLAGLGAGICLYALAYAATTVWSHAVPTDVFAEQTKEMRLLQEALGDNLLPALLLALLTAASEEILFRGALQPVFGALITSIFFTLLHPALLYTPGMLIIFGLSLGLGWLRIRWNTGVAVAAHASYNFLPFLLAHAGAA